MRPPNRVHSDAGSGDNPPLEVLRVKDGETLKVVFLTATVRGCYTHWAGGRTRYCDPDCCKWGCPRKERIWKGYDLVDAHDPVADVWRSYVLEVTEHLELDLRGRYARGQAWELSREKETTNKKRPVTGKLLGVVRADAVPPAVDFTPVLLTLFHEARIALNVANPMPPRMVATVRKGKLPLESNVEEASTADVLNLAGRLSTLNGKPHKASKVQE